MSRPPALDGAITAEGRLVGIECADCGACYFPPSEMCPRCGGAVRERTLSGRGRIYSWTVVRRPPAGLEAPYVYAWVDTEEGPRLAGQVAAPVDEISPGMAVLVCVGPAPAGGPADGFFFSPAPPTGTGSATGDG